MGAVIKVNGEEVPNSLIVVDTLNNNASLETLDSCEIMFGTDKVYIEVNIYGDISL